MTEFMEDFIDFVGRRIIKAKDFSAHIDIPEDKYTGLSDAELVNARDSVDRDGVYIQGMADGMQLARMLYEAKDDNV